MAQRKGVQSGLTLIELLAVLTIIGIIAAIAVPTIGGMITGSKDKADAASEAILAEAAKRYLLDYEMNHEALSANRVLVLTETLTAGGYLDSTPRSEQLPGTTYLGVCVERMPVGWFPCPVNGQGSLQSGTAPLETESGPFQGDGRIQQWGLSSNGKKIITDAYLMSKSS